MWFLWLIFWLTIWALCGILGYLLYSWCFPDKAYRDPSLQDGPTPYERFVGFVFLGGLVLPVMLAWLAFIWFWHGLPSKNKFLAFSPMCWIYDRIEDLNRKDEDDGDVA